MTPSDAPKTREAIAELLKRGHWYTAEEIAGYLMISCRRTVSGSACTARTRELRLPKFGKHTVSCRPRKGSTAYEYLIEVSHQVAA